MGDLVNRVDYRITVTHVYARDAFDGLSVSRGTSRRERFRVARNLTDFRFVSSADQTKNGLTLLARNTSTECLEFLDKVLALLKVKSLPSA